MDGRIVNSAPIKTVSMHGNEGQEESLPEVLIYKFNKKRGCHIYIINVMLWAEC